MFFSILIQRPSWWRHCSQSEKETSLRNHLSPNLRSKLTTQSCSFSFLQLTLNEKILCHLLSNLVTTIYQFLSSTCCFVAKPRSRAHLVGVGSNPVEPWSFQAFLSVILLNYGSPVKTILLLFNEYICFVFSFFLFFLRLLLHMSFIWSSVVFTCEQALILRAWGRVFLRPKGSMRLLATRVDGRPAGNLALKIKPDPRRKTCRLVSTLPVGGETHVLQILRTYSYSTVVLTLFWRNNTSLRLHVAKLLFIKSCIHSWKNSLWPQL